jgi:hypothetical protein
MRPSTLLRPHDEPIGLSRETPDDDALRAGREREPSSGRSPEGELQRRPTDGLVRRLVRLVVALLVILMVLLTTAVLLTGDAPVNEQLTPAPGVEILQD